MSTQKKNLRSEIIKKRVQMDPETLAHASSCITQSIVNTPLFQGARNILVFLSFKNEVDTSEIILAALAQGSQVFVPVVVDKNSDLKLVAYYGPQTPMRLSSYGIREPLISDQNTTTIDAIDLVLAPGVAFDRMGHRMGYGGGFYDRMLEKVGRDQLWVIALAFSMQIVDEVPCDPWDALMDAIITEDEVIIVKSDLANGPLSQV